MSTDVHVLKSGMELTVFISSQTWPETFISSDWHHYPPDGKARKPSCSEPAFPHKLLHSIISLAASSPKTSWIHPPSSSSPPHCSLRSFQCCLQPETRQAPNGFSDSSLVLFQSSPVLFLNHKSDHTMFPLKHTDSFLKHISLVQSCAVRYDSRWLHVSTEHLEQGRRESRGAVSNTYQIQRPAWKNVKYLIHSFLYWITCWNGNVFGHIKVNILLS